MKTLNGKTIKITKRQQSSISHHFNPHLANNIPSEENPVEHTPTLPLDQRRFASQGVRRSDRIRKRRREPTPSLPTSAFKNGNSVTHYAPSAKVLVKIGNTLSRVKIKLDMICVKNAFQILN